MASSPLGFYTLPCSLAYRCTDRFSLLDDDSNDGEPLQDSNGLVPFWPLLRSLLSQPVTSPAALDSLLDTISVTLRGTSHPASDYALLHEAIIVNSSQGEQGFFRRVWPRLVDLALQMPVLFPEGYIPVLGREATRLSFSRRQTACLVYAGEEHQRQPSAVRAYLGALMGYFAEVVCEEGRVGTHKEEWEVAYTLQSLTGDLADAFSGIPGRGRPLGEVKVMVVERYDMSPASLGLPDGAVVVASNKFIGFGQSATQEEVHVGTSPEACPAVLVTPPLRDDQVLVVRGAQAMINVTGRGRDIRAEKMPVPNSSEKSWRHRTMLFMDALELDMVEHRDLVLPDLQPGNIDREVRKAYTAFASAGFEERRQDELSEMSTTFGNFSIKAGNALLLVKF
ncbi:poly(ADP-ribose) glycohydrolase [Madurella fahalii]|uniref:poly(ADP-ribose) glycohydrolase n=1 Tax=Madurella fahalii TaxID=1157608 RepID=A0ABQ0FYM7_9PEZI